MDVRTVLKIENEDLRKKIADLENEIEALKEERGDLLMHMQLIQKITLRVMPISSFSDLDPRPVTPEEMRWMGL